MNDIARRPNQKGKLPVRGGESWSASTIKGKLDDEGYLDKLVFGKMRFIAAKYLERVVLRQQVSCA